MKLFVFLLLLGVLNSARAGGYYDLEVVARPGDVLESGGSLVSLGVECSIANAGAVGFAATLNDGASSGEMAAVRKLGAVAAVRISDGALDGRRFNFLQLSESGAAIGRERRTPGFDLKLYNWSDPVEVLTAVTTDTGAFAYVTVPTMAADGGFSFVGELVTGFQAELYVNGVSETALAGGGHRPFAANGGKCVVRNGGTTDGKIAVYGGGEMVLADAAGSGWAEVGRMPGASVDGDAVVFYGKRGGVGDEAGVFVALSSADGSEYESPVDLTGLSITAGVPLMFDPAGFDLSGDGRRVACSVDGEVLTVVFAGTPAAGSVGMNYSVDGEVFTVGAGAGVWAMRVPLTEDAFGDPVLGATAELVPILQVGDVVDGQVTTSLFLSDPLASCGLVALYVGSADGGRILRALPRALDGDFDGVPDLVEVALGAAAGDGASLPAFDLERFAVGGDSALQLRYSRVIGSAARVEQSVDLVNWSTVGVVEVVTGAGGAGELVRATVIGGDRVFLRVTVGCFE